MEISSFQYTDIVLLKRIQPEGWSGLEPVFQYYLDASYCEPIKVTHKGDLLGVGVAILYPTTAWLAHIIVDENHRRQGIGHTIVEALLNLIKLKNIPTTILIATDLGYPVYKKIGFQKDTEYAFLKREKPWTLPSISSEFIVPYHEKYKTDVLSLDKKITGEKRMILLDEYLRTSFLYVKDEKVLGYSIPDLREGPIYAIDPEAGLAFMQLKFANTDRAILPIDNQIGIDFLLQNGFVPYDYTGIRMVYGQAYKWQASCFYNRIGGNLG